MQEFRIVSVRFLQRRGGLEGRSSRRACPEDSPCTAARAPRAPPGVLPTRARRNRPPAASWASSPRCRGSIWSPSTPSSPASWSLWRPRISSPSPTRPDLSLPAFAQSVPGTFLSSPACLSCLAGSCNRRDYSFDSPYQSFQFQTEDPYLRRDGANERLRTEFGSSKRKF